MITLRHYLDTYADSGTYADWTINFKPTGYEAVQRGSGDNYYISSSTLNDTSSFDCGNGPVPELGFVSAVTVHYRYKATASGGGQLQFALHRAGVAVTTGAALTPTTAWADGVLRVTQDPITSARFVSSGLSALEAAVTVSTAPTAGELWVSEMWLEVEWSLSPENYDPQVVATTPDLITGDMAWNTTGTQVGAISSGQLRIQDASAVDWREYNRAILEYGSDYITEVSTRLVIATATVGPSFIFRIVQVDDAVYAPELCAFLDAAGDPYIGLITDGLDRSDPTAYFATYGLDWTTSHHYRVVIDRAPDPGDSDRVRVFVDYDTTPVMNVIYQKFVGTSGSALISFGSGFAAAPVAQSDSLIDFFDWWTYHRSGEWRYWYSLAESTNAVNVCSTDPYIVRPMLVSPPGIHTGQSERCCELEVNAVAAECSVRTYVPVPEATVLYDLAVDYRIDTLATDAKLSVQRTSDHYYWNDTTDTWQAAAADVTLSYSPGRTRALGVVTGLVSATLPESLIIKIRNDTGAGSAHKVYLYKVDMREQ